MSADRPLSEAATAQQKASVLLPLPPFCVTKAITLMEPYAYPRIRRYPSDIACTRGDAPLPCSTLALLRSLHSISPSPLLLHRRARLYAYPRILSSPHAIVRPHHEKPFALLQG